ncbi:DUF1799 domain-containing protein [Pseudomonas sp. NPDC089407]|uniref:DUF1799 domain-containing protein n=1 Tax=Pseudomonas sp. NPDC089407 TaxID=3364464 RepID=UPI00384D2498
MAAFGLTQADVGGEEQQVWPENWPAFCVFEALTTQWRVGPGGASGLDYGAIPAVLDLVGIRKKERAGVFGDLRHMEGVILKQWAEERPSS